MPAPVAVVSAGGEGVRMWPVSRTRRPKQFQPISGDAPLLTMTVERLKKHFPVDRIYVSTLARYRDLVRECCPDLPQANILLEREGKGPATALVLALARIRAVRGDVPVFSCPSDHVIADEAAYLEAVAEMLRLLDDDPETPVLLGIRPTTPDGSLGYVEARPVAGTDRLEAVSFTEKPSEAEARRLVESGSFYWNSACYALRPDSALAIVRQSHPETVAAIEQFVGAEDPEGYDGPRIAGHEMEPFFAAGIRPALVAGDFGWSDVGTWSSFEAWLTSQGAGSVGSSVDCEAKRTLTVSMDGRPIVVVGSRDLIVVSHEDAVYVIDKSVTTDAEILDQMRSLVGDRLREDLL